MKIYSKAEWAREQYKGRWEASPFNLDQVGRGEIPAYYIGRRNVMVGGDHGCTLLTEGVHFLVEGEFEELPVLSKENAMVGACYQFAGGYIEVLDIYRISEEYAKENQLCYVERVNTTGGDFALPGSDLRSDLRKGN